MAQLFAHPFEIEKLTGLLERGRLETYLKLSDAWTTPSLSQRVEISSFAEKILRNGVAVFAVGEGHLDLGLAAFYCNDPERACAYLTHFAVSPEYRGRGIARALMEFVKSHSKSVGMISLELEVYSENAAARNFYSSCGFVETRSAASVWGSVAVYMSCSLT